VTLKSSDFSMGHLSGGGIRSSLSRVGSAMFSGNRNLSLK